MIEVRVVLGVDVIVVYRVLSILVLIVCTVVIICFDSVYVMYILRNETFFFFKQKTAYEMRISDWSSDVCSSDLAENLARDRAKELFGAEHVNVQPHAG